MRLTLKQRKFIAKYLETGSATEAAFEAYGTKNRNVAASIGSENLRKPNIKRVIQYALEAAGITDDYLAMSLKKIIDAGVPEI